MTETAMIRGYVLRPLCCNRFGLGKGFSIATKHFKSQQSLVKARSFYVATKYFFCRDRVWLWIGFLCRDKVFLCRDRVWLRQEILGRDRVISCRNRVCGKGQESLHRDREFDVATEFPEIERDRVYLMSRQRVPGHEVFHVAT